LPVQCQSRQIAKLDPEYTGLFNTDLKFNDKYLCFLEDFNQISTQNAFLVKSDLNSKASSVTKQYDILHMLCQDNNDPLIQNGQHPFAFSAKANSEDNPNLQEALDGPDREGFIEAMHLELEQLESMDAWVVVPREKA
jgi:hypothetical protein